MNSNQKYISAEGYMTEQIEMKYIYIYIYNKVQYIILKCYQYSFFNILIEYSILIVREYNVYRKLLQI